MTKKIIVGVPREADAEERRVALVPTDVPGLLKAGVDVIVQSSAGLTAGITDEQYAARGVRVVAERSAVFSEADVILAVRALGACGATVPSDASDLRDGQILIAGCEPLWCPQALQDAVAARATIFALELVPRITRAQSMDILSSMATVAGYKAVLLAAAECPRMFPILMTAAGTLKPARVLVIGAGVAGLQAIATARRLGAVVLGYDIRPAVREQVESLGARFVELDVKADGAEARGGYAKEMGEDFYRRQREAMKQVLSECNVVITTAAIPGKKAPVLLTKDMVEAMASGSVIVDMAERGGNCEITQAGSTVRHNGVTIIGPTNLASTIPIHASEMFSRNITTFLKLLVRNGAVSINLQDEIIRETLVARDGEIVHRQVRELLGLPSAAAEPVSASAAT